MTDLDPTTAGTAARFGRRRRVRLFALMGLIALGSGGTGALAATVVRHSDPQAPASSGPSVYIPYAGPQGGAGSGSTTGSGGPAAPNATRAQSALSAPAYLDSSIAYPYPYPGPGICTASAPTQVTGQVLTATGTSTIDVGQVAPVYVLYASVSSQGSGDVSHAVSDVQNRLNAVVNALVGAGVKRSSIHTSSVSVYAGGGKVGGPVPLPATGEPVTRSESANASLTAQLADAGSIDKAVTAAANAGADSVNASTQAPPVGAPSADALSAALAQAADQAHQLAAAGAKATGVTLGAIRSVSTQQPALCGYGVNGPQLVVGVTVAYAIG